MRIAIFDGDPRPRGSALDRQLTAFVAEATGRGDHCRRLRLAEMTVHQCVGCFSCWVKTPGRCRLRDDGDQLLAATANVDLLVFASPMRMGFVTSLLKRANDRVLPNLLPYVRVVGGECHHPVRYKPFDLALLVERGDATADELAATERIYGRLAKNTSGKLAWSKVIDGDDVQPGIPVTLSGKEHGHALRNH
jgi:multimeric flavodoxin WrbA